MSAFLSKLARFVASVWTPPMTATKEGVLVIFAGAIGGAIAWIYSITLGEPFKNVQTMGAVSASVAFGAFAAFVMVFWIANTDTTSMRRCMAFALICGVGWKPVFEGVTAYVNKAVVQKNQTAMRKKLEELQESAFVLQQSSGSSESARDLVAKIDSLLKGYPSIVDSELRADVGKQVALASDALVIWAPKTNAVDALDNLAGILRQITSTDSKIQYLTQLDARIDKNKQWVNYLAYNPTNKYSAAVANWEKSLEMQLLSPIKGSVP